MIKLLFIAVIIFSSAGIGNVIVGEWEERRKSIGAMQSAVKVLISALGFQGMPLYDALMAASKINFTQHSPFPINRKYPFRATSMELIISLPA